MRVKIMHLYELDQYRYKYLSFAVVAYYRQYISPLYWVVELVELIPPTLGAPSSVCQH
jgi:hypothetical protein